MKKNEIAGIMAATACLAFLGGCLSNRCTTVQDSTGARVALQQPAARIVSTVPSNTEILYALGLKDQVVGVTEYCGKTCDTTGKIIVGGWVNPNCEKIRALKPDLIFAFGGAQRKRLDQFRAIAPTYCFEPTTVEETFRVIRDIGRLTRRAPEAKEIIKKQKEVLVRVQAGLFALPSQDRLRVARVFGTSTNVTTAGGRSFLTDVIKRAGGENIFGDEDDDYPQVSFERLAALNPDVLIVHGEKDEVKKKKVAFRESAAFSKLKAVQNDRVLVYSCADICHPNAAIADTIAMVARGLYPGIFNKDNHE
ncbi:MAG: ABC transporter substrate-binding protein [Verrucomicrobia bacterium]|nr:ABC transporter substrate-binding protein [Verrucomicrobiota bacterium]MBU4291015.1 ABC transporter substrate-binding protein [Verrucomicrobiota bacterium]MBU4429902.1 ABC transporter substrate-binding protein [Verrucomicrobiota bacterium]MCG2678905.1 ABC transporter substrate-binding protein [Kiritimatiellia bacterium]